MNVHAFEAVADPTRRRILELLGAGERSAGDLASQFDISRPAVSRHLRMLRETGLVEARGDAQRQLYSLRRDGVDEIGEWIDTLRAFWSQHLDALDKHTRPKKRSEAR
jgi:DNA-binding transcriptional ArsR family regulator